MCEALVIGSLNIDDVFVVPHIVRSGETLSSISYSKIAGGKGANQSVALSRAGCKVSHVGCVGDDGTWLVDLLSQNGVDTTFVQVLPDVVCRALFA
jgi:ribokinase